MSFEWERTGVDLIAYLQVGRLGPATAALLSCDVPTGVLCSVYASEGVYDCG